MKLSIIIPYYNCEAYTNELLDILDKQISKDVEILLIDDGSKVPFDSNYEWLKIYRKENGGVSSARNLGLEKAKGDYIAFIDSDDIVSPNYIPTILYKIDKENFDYCYMSWKTIGKGWQYHKKLVSIDDKYEGWNCCCWCRVYKREPIKDIRFNENKCIAEDAEFIRLCEKRLSKKSFISDFLYYYRSDTPNSLTKRYANGEFDMNRIVYYFNHINKDMTYLIDEIRELDKNNEVIIMTRRNDLKELENYAMITTPQIISGSELRGEPTTLFNKIYKPLKAQIIMYTNNTTKIGGIETYIYNWCLNMKDTYDIIVLYDSIDLLQKNRLEKIVKVVQNSPKLKLSCDTLILNRISDNPPKNITYKKLIRNVHSCKIKPEWVIPKDADITIPVSDSCEKSFEKELIDLNHKVITNFSNVNKAKRVLKLISCTRLSFEKGSDRMITLAKMLNSYKIPFQWLIFSDEKLKEPIDGVCYMSPRLDVEHFIKDADYLVQLSDSESWGYSIVESLLLGTPILVTPLETLSEMGFENETMGYILDYDMSNIDVDKIYNEIPKFEYKDDKNKNRKKQWIELLGEPKEFKPYVYRKDNFMKIRGIVEPYYTDNVEGRNIYYGEEYETSKERATLIISKGYAVEVIEDKKELKDLIKEEVKDEVIKKSKPKKK